MAKFSDNTNCINRKLFQVNLLNRRGALSRDGCMEALCVARGAVEFESCSSSVGFTRSMTLIDNLPMDLLHDLPLLTFYLANACYALAYLVRNMLGLRTLSVIASFMTFPYFIFQSQVLYSALLWQSIFALINLINIARLLNERRPVVLTEQQQHLKNLAFRNYTSREMLKLLDIAQWRDGVEGQVLIDSDSNIDSLYLLYSGSVDVVKNGGFLARRRPGAFLGEVHFMTGDRTIAQVVFAEDATYLRWRASELRALLEKNESMGRAFDSMLTMDMARKLRRDGNTSTAGF